MAVNGLFLNSSAYKFESALGATLPGEDPSDLLLELLPRQLSMRIHLFFYHSKLSNQFWTYGCPDRVKKLKKLTGRKKICFRNLVSDQEFYYGSLFPALTLPNFQ